MTKHPAKFTDAILETAVGMLNEALWYEREPLVLDPFAGTGKGVDRIAGIPGWRAVGVELEPEWAALSEHVIVGNAHFLPFPSATFDAVFTSPTYGNRMADRDMRPSVAGTYAKSLGHHASAGSSAHLQWGDAYRRFHHLAWSEADRVLKRGGYMLLNCSDHVRAKQLQFVTLWHVADFLNRGYEPCGHWMIPTPRLRRGANSHARVAHEDLVLLRKPA